MLHGFHHVKKIGPYYKTDCVTKYFSEKDFIRQTKHFPDKSYSNDMLNNKSKFDVDHLFFGEFTITPTWMDSGRDSQFYSHMEIVVN